MPQETRLCSIIVINQDENRINIEREGGSERERGKIERGWWGEGGGDERKF